jgi:type II secretory pathway predicted ATPase ExeA
MDIDEELHEEELWFRKFGFFNNPFSIKPAHFDNKIFGQDKLLESLFYQMPAGTMNFIQGPLGTGKTSVLQHLINKYRGQKKVIFFSCNRIDSDLNIEELLKGKYGFWGRLFGLMPKNMLLLLDEAQDLTPVNTERIKYFFDQGNIKSTVFVGTNFKETNFHKSIQERIGNNIFNVKELTEEEAVDLVRNRIGELELISDEIIRKVFLLSNKNPRRMLQNLDRLCNEAVQKHEKEVKVEDIKKLGIELPIPQIPSRVLSSTKRIIPLRKKRTINRARIR